MVIRIKPSFRRIGLSCLILFFMFQSVFMDITPSGVSILLEYADELLALVSLIYVLVHIKSVDRVERQMMVICCGLLALGFASSLNTKLQPLLPTVIDAFICSRFFLIYVGFHMYWKRSKLTLGLYCGLNTILRMVSVVLFVLVIINTLFIQIFPVYDYRFFFPSQKLFFRNCADLAYVCMNGLIIMILNERNHKKNIVFMILFTITAISAMRYKELAVIIAIWIMYTYMILGQMKSRFFLVLGSIFSAGVFGIDQFSLYYNNIKQPRYLLMRSGIIIANKCFPLGAGFATFGSHISGVYYSPLYKEYGLSLIWGLGGNYKGFISDNFFAILLGQFGWLGLGLIVYLYFFLVKECFRINDKHLFIPALSLVLFLIISAFGTSSIFNPLSVFISILLANIMVSENAYHTKSSTCA